MRAHALSFSQLGQHLSHLVRLAEEFNIVVFVINQCMADPGALSMFVR
jgi:meiotic recombination protein DMC1